MFFLVLSFIAGVLTVAAPCILPLLPVIIGGSIIGSPHGNASKSWKRPLVIAISLAVSVVLFTLILKASTTLLGVPPVVWQLISGLIVVSIGLYFILPTLGDVVLTHTSGIFTHTNKILGKVYVRPGLTGAVLIGAALGPVFSSCSPTYALIVATVLPASFLQGLLYLLAYAVGMSGTLLLIAYLGQSFVAKLRWASNPNGWFKRSIGFMFILVGLLVLFGFDKDIQSFVLDQGWYDPISNIEKSLR